MSKLDQITEKIKADAGEQAASILSEMDEKIRAMTASAVEKAEFECARRIAYTEASMPALTEQIVAHSSLEARDLVLQAKQEVISRVMTEAENRLNSLGDTDLARMIGSALEKSPAGPETVVLLPPGRKPSLPAGVRTEESSELKSGFAIRRGDVLEKHDFTETLRILRDELEGGILQLLKKG